MKKSMFSIIVGLMLGVMFMVAVVFALNMKPNNEDALAQNPNVGTSDKVEIDTSDWLIDESEFSEIIFEEGTQSEESEVTEETQQLPVPVPTPTPKPTPAPTNYPYYIRVNRLANCVTVYKQDANGNYSIPVKAMICSVGLTDDTPLGVHKIIAKYKWRPLFGGTYAQYAVRFVGTYLFHSVPYTKQSKDSLLEGAFNMLGQPASQGCVRLAAADAKWLYDNCAYGTKVEVYESSDPGPLGKPSSYKISENSPFRGWDPTDPDPANPWKTGKVSIVGVKDITTEKGQMVDLLAGVSATDVDGLPLQVECVGTVNWNEAGVYTINYRATGVLEMTETKTATITVIETQPSESEVPEDTEIPKDTETPGDTEVPSDTQIPDNTETPEDTEIPKDTELPSNTEIQGNTESIEEIENTEETLIN